MISVIIPVYNVQDYLKKCIDSVINQTYKELQIILVDDGSTDNCGKMCDEYALIDQRIIVIHKNNGGLSEARNFGLKIAKGDFISFIDSDDYIHPRYYEILIKIALKNKVDAVICKYTSDEKELLHNEDMNKINAVLYNAKKDFPILHDIVVWNKIYKRDIFNNLQFPVGKFHEDEFIAHRIFYNCDKVAKITEKLYYYRIREGSIMCLLSEKKILDAIDAFEDRLKFVQEHQWNDALSYAITNYSNYCFYMYFKLKETNDKQYKHLKKLLRQRLREKIKQFGSSFFSKECLALSIGEYVFYLCALQLKLKEFILKILRRIIQSLRSKECKS